MIVADPHYFSIFHYHWLCGSPTDLNLPNYVVLTLKQAIKYFGEMPVDSFLGRDIVYQDKIFNASFHMTVSGIVQDWESPSDFGFTDFISMGSVYGNSVLKRLIGLEDWDWWYFTSQVFVQLVPGVSPSLPGSIRQ